MSKNLRLVLLILLIVVILLIGVIILFRSNILNNEEMTSDEIIQKELDNLEFNKENQIQDPLLNIPQNNITTTLDDID